MQPPPPPLSQSAASKAYHASFMQPADNVLWMSRLRPSHGLQEQMLAYGVQPRGMLHVGAHYGLDLEAYLVAGFERITFFEASPLVIQQLRAHVAFWRDWLHALKVGPVQLEVVECAVSDQEGPVEMYVTELEMLSSLHRPTADWIQVQAKVSVRRTQLDRLVPRPFEFNVLKLDVQGHELEVLRGATRTLASLDAVLVELNFTPCYEGCARAEQIDACLTKAGYSYATEERREDDVVEALYLKRQTS